jgi:hypothetical protein
MWSLVRTLPNIERAAVCHCQIAGFLLLISFFISSKISLHYTLHIALICNLKQLYIAAIINLYCTIDENICKLSFGSFHNV